MWKILSSSKRRDAASPLPVPDLCGHPVARMTFELYHFFIALWRASVCQLSFASARDVRRVGYGAAVVNYLVSAH